VKEEGKDLSVVDNDCIIINMPILGLPPAMNFRALCIICVQATVEITVILGHL